MREVLTFTLTNLPMREVATFTLTSQSEIKNIIGPMGEVLTFTPGSSNLLRVRIMAAALSLFLSNLYSKNKKVCHAIL